MLAIDRIRAAYTARPFQPFVIHMADGRDIPVLSFEFMSFAPDDKRTITVNTPDGKFHILDILLVTGLEFRREPGSPPPSAGQSAPAPVS